MSDLFGNPDCWFSHAKAQQLQAFLLLLTNSQIQELASNLKIEDMPNESHIFFLFTACKLKTEKF